MTSSTTSTVVPRRLDQRQPSRRVSGKLPVAAADPVDELDDWRPSPSGDLSSVLAGLNSGSDAEQLQSLTLLVSLIDDLPSDGLPPLCCTLRDCGACALLVDLLDKQALHQDVLLVLGNIAADAVDPEAFRTREVLTQCGIIRSILPYLWSESYESVLYALSSMVHFVGDVSQLEAFRLAKARIRIQELASSDDEMLATFASSCLEGMAGASVAVLVVVVQSVTRGFLLRIRLKKAKARLTAKREAAAAEKKAAAEKLRLAEKAAEFKRAEAAKAAEDEDRARRAAAKAAQEEAAIRKAARAAEEEAARHAAATAKGMGSSLKPSSDVDSSDDEEVEQFVEPQATHQLSMKSPVLAAKMLLGFQSRRSLLAEASKTAEQVAATMEREAAEWEEAARDIADQVVMGTAALDTLSPVRREFLSEEEKARKAVRDLEALKAMEAAAVAAEATAAEEAAARMQIEREARLNGAAEASTRQAGKNLEDYLRKRVDEKGQRVKPATTRPSRFPSSLYAIPARRQKKVETVGQTPDTSMLTAKKLKPLEAMERTKRILDPQGGFKPNKMKLPHIAPQRTSLPPTEKLLPLGLSGLDRPSGRLKLDGNGRILLPTALSDPGLHSAAYGLPRQHHCTFDELRISDRNRAHTSHLQWSSPRLGVSHSTPVLPSLGTLQCVTETSVPLQLSQLLAQSSTRLIDFFRTCDTDGNGRLERPELVAALSVLGYEASGERELDDVFREFGGEVNGYVTFQDLKRALIFAVPLSDRVRFFAGGAV